MAWENSRNFATSPLFSPRSDIWETSAKFPPWWRATTQLWVVLLISWSKFSAKQIQVVRSSAWSYKGAEKHIVNFDLWGVLVDKSGWITKLAVTINALFKVLLSRLLLLWICETLEGSSQRKINVNTMHFNASTKIGSNLSNSSLRKQPTFQDATNGFPSKWRSRNELRNSKKMMRHYLDLFAWKFASANQQHYSHLGSNASSVWKICARFSDVFRGGKKWWRREIRLFSQAIETPHKTALHYEKTK